MRELVPQPADSGKRMDAWLAGLFPDLPRAAVRRAIDRGALQLGGRPCSKGDRVREQTVYLLVTDPEPPAAVQPNPEIPLDIVYEDEALIACNKPAGLDCQPNDPAERDTLANAVLARYPEVAGVGDGPLTCGILHRIDRDTSGLVLAARSQTVYDALRAQFAAHAIEKHYRALVCGSVTHPAHLEHLLAHNPRCPGRMVDAAKWTDVRRPMKAVTDYRPLSRHRLGGRPCTLLDVTILTGVTHQIRAQLSFAGLPIAGDRRYGGAQLPDFPRHFLHAYTAGFIHPITLKPLTLKAPLTPELQALLDGKA